MIKNTLIASLLLVGAVYALYGNARLIEQKSYKEDLMREKMYALGIGTKGK